MTDFAFGDDPILQRQRFFLVEGALPALSAEVQAIHEREGIGEMRWWPAAEIEAARAEIFPRKSFLK